MPKLITEDMIEQAATDRPPWVGGCCMLVQFRHEQQTHKNQEGDILAAHPKKHYLGRNCPFAPSPGMYNDRKRGVGHRPHPETTLKAYAVKKVRNYLMQIGEAP